MYYIEKQMPKYNFVSVKTPSNYNLVIFLDLGAIMEFQKRTDLITNQML